MIQLQMSTLLRWKNPVIRGNNNKEKEKKEKTRLIQKKVVRRESLERID